MPGEPSVTGVVGGRDYEYSRLRRSSGNRAVFHVGHGMDDTPIPQSRSWHPSSWSAPRSTPDAVPGAIYSREQRGRQRALPPGSASRSTPRPTAACRGSLGSEWHPTDPRGPPHVGDQPGRMRAAALRAGRPRELRRPRPSSPGRPRISTSPPTITVSTSAPVAK